jgi:hypothetical protein
MTGRRLLFFFLLCLVLCSVAFAQNLSPTTLPNGTAGVYYNQTVTAIGIGSVSYCNIASGTWPFFMSLSYGGTACYISSSNPSQQTFSFTLHAHGTSSDAYQSYTLSFTTPLSVTTTSLAGGLQGSAYSQTLGAPGGTGSGYSWSISSGSLPPGLSLSGAGVISGTPTDRARIAFK